MIPIGNAREGQRQPVNNATNASSTKVCFRIQRMALSIHHDCENRIFTFFPSRYVAHQATSYVKLPPTAQLVPTLHLIITTVQPILSSACSAFGLTRTEDVKWKRHTNDPSTPSTLHVLSVPRVTAFGRKMMQPISQLGSILPDPNYNISGSDQEHYALLWTSNIEVGAFWKPTPNSSGGNDHRALYRHHQC